VFRRADRPLGLAPAGALDYRELARRRLPRQHFDYIDGGSYDEATLRANVEDLARLHLRQRVLRDVGTRDQSVRVLGQPLSMPVVLAPVGMAGINRRRGEVQAARAAAAHGVPFVESTVSVCGIEEVVRGAGTPPWFQLYVMRDRSYAIDLLQRAAAAGSPVLVLTVDLPVLGARLRDDRNGLVGPQPPWSSVRRLLDLAAHPRWALDVGVRGKPHTFGNLEQAVPGAGTPKAFRSWVDAQFDPSVTWADLDWVRAHWSGPIVVKGILDADDAVRAAEAGVDAIVVSNHGGRQLDGVPSTASALPAVVDAVGGRIEVLADGGVRTGLDVVRLCALGARAVLIGRAWAWALAARGEAGVRHLLTRLHADIDTALGLTGCTSIAALDRSALVQG
jgi:L-lactate dehydrogenase (cytochrome)